MIKRFSTQFAVFCMFLDGLLVMAAFRLAQTVRPFIAPFIEFAKELPDPQPINPYLYLLMALVWIVVLMRLGIYDPEKNLRVVDEIYNLMAGTITSFTVTAGMFYIVERDISRLVFFIFMLITPLLLIFHRTLIRLVFQKRLRRNSSHHRILVVGAGLVGRRFKKEFMRYAQLGYVLVGFLDDNPDLVRDDPEVLGTLDQTIDLIKAHHIDQLVITLPERAYQRLNAIVEGVHKLPVRI
jgi:FlaA1/EpsC-like NDP-sugar epimerase